MKKRVVIVDDHTSIREMLAVLLKHWEGFEVVGEAGTGSAALCVCARLRPDLVILDLVLPEMCGVEVLRRLHAMHGSSIAVLVYSATTNDQLLVEMFQTHPAGFVGKTETLKTLREALSTVAAGGNYFTPFAARHLLGARIAGWGGGSLSGREREILQRVAESQSSKEIAGHLGISVKTVDNHRAHLMEKLELHDVASLTRYAIRTGLISAE